VCCGKKECEHVVLYYEDWQQIDWRYAKAELGVDIYRCDPGMRLHSAIVAAIRAHCSIAPALSMQPNGVKSTLAAR